ncbi:MAG: hypothetical protein NTZ18_00315 [Candidatus Komeilibacteria bacterium]|nr:hypothetical protein [Candidatus Komeilibacteria bacterium]
MERIHEIIDLIQVTGDKCIILHQEQGAFVVMKFEDYKKLAKNVTPAIMAPVAALTKPETDIRIYEIPRLQREEDDQYWPEPLV